MLARLERWIDTIAWAWRRRRFPSPMSEAWIDAHVRNGWHA